MPYGEIVSRSFSIFWRHKYLWLLGALGGGETAYGSNFGNLGGNAFTGSGNPGGGGNGPDVAAVFGHWVVQNIGLIAVLVALVLVFFIIYFFVSCVAMPATVRAAAEHDADRPFDFRLAWRAGVSAFLSVLGLRLLTLLVVLAVLIILILLVALGIGFAASGQGGGVVLAIALGILLVLAFIPFSIGLGLTVSLAIRAVVLEERGMFAALRRGFQLFTSRLGRVLLLWLIQFGLALALGVVLNLLSLVLLLPLAALLALAYFSGGGIEGLLTAGAIALAVYVIGVIVLGGAAGSFMTTYWTLGFRRLEVETPRYPAYYPPAAPASP